MQPSLSERWKSWTERMDKCGLPPNLGRGGSLVAILVSSFFAAALADVFIVILGFGPHAYFMEGLRVTDWKHGLLSTGAELPSIGVWLLVLMTMLFWVILIGAAELSAGLLALYLARQSRWVCAILRLGGGLLLVVFAVWFCRNHDTAVFHPVPCAAFIGGAVLIGKALVGLIKPKK